MNTPEISNEEKKRLKGQVRLYESLFQQYGVPSPAINVMKTNAIFDTLRLQAESLRQRLKLIGAIKDLNTWAKTQIRISRVDARHLYIQVHRNTTFTHSATYMPTVLTDSQKVARNVPIGTVEGIDSYDLNFSAIKNLLILGGPRMGKTNVIRVLARRLTENYPETRIHIFTRRKEEFEDIAGNIEFYDKAQSLSILEDVSRDIDASNLGTHPSTERFYFIDEIYDFYPDESLPQFNRAYAFLKKCLRHGSKARVHFVISTSVFHSDMITKRFLDSFSCKLFLRLPFASEANDLGCKDAIHLASHGDAIVITDGQDTRINIPLTL
jgi:hypothetical protein